MPKKKPLNRHSKGQYYERLVKKHKEEVAGFVCFKPVWSRFSKSKDMFGSDFFCWHPITKQLHFVQVKSNSKHLLEAIKEFENKMDSVSEVYQEIWFGGTIHSQNKISNKPEEPLKVC